MFPLGVSQSKALTMDAASPPTPRRNLSPGRAFTSVFVTVFLLIFLSSGLITFILPESYTSVARVRASTPEQAGSFESTAVLTTVIERLDLNKKYAQRYGETDPLATERTLQLLRRMVQVRPVRGTGAAEIRVQDLDRNEAAHLANAIARTGVTNAVFATASDPQGRSEIIDLALPALKPSRPNKPLNLALGALVGAFLGVLAGGVAARLAIGIALRSGARIQMVSPEEQKE